MKGSIAKARNKDGTPHYRARVDVGMDNATGKRRQKERWFERKADAERWVADTVAKVQRNEWADPGHATVGEYVQRWMSAHRADLAPRSRARYESAARAHVLPAWQAAPLASVRTSDLRGWFDRLRTSGRLTRGGGGLSVDSLRYVRSVLHQSFALAVEDGMLQRNPVASIHLPQPKPRDVQPLTAEQVRTLLEAAHGHRLWSFFVLALTTGARAGELLATRWEDLDLAAGVLTIRHSLQRVKGEGLVLGPPKTVSSQRTVDLPNMAVSALTAHRRQQAAERLKAGALYSDGGFVFANEAGAPLDESNVYHRLWLPMLVRAGLPRMRLHDARHTHASMLVDGGVNLKVVQDRLGHADPRILLQRYAHRMPGAQRAAADKMDSLLRPRHDGDRSAQ